MKNRPLNEGYQPIEKGYQPQGLTSQVNPPKGGTGESAPKPVVQSNDKK